VGRYFGAQFFLAFSPDKRVALASLEVFRASLVTVHGHFFILVTGRDNGFVGNSPCGTRDALGEYWVSTLGVIFAISFIVTSVVQTSISRCKIISSFRFISRVYIAKCLVLAMRVPSLSQSCPPSLIQPHNIPHSPRQRPLRLSFSFPMHVPSQTFLNQPRHLLRQPHLQLLYSLPPTQNLRCQPRAWQGWAYGT